MKTVLFLSLLFAGPISLAEGTIGTAKIKLVAANVENDVCREEALSVAKFSFDQLIEGQGGNSKEGTVLKNTLKLTRQGKEPMSFIREYTVAAKGVLGDDYVIKMIFDGCGVIRTTIDFKKAFHFE